MIDLPKDPKPNDDEFYSDEETVRRRDETLRQALNMPPMPHKPAKQKQKLPVKRRTRKVRAT